jgi:hypothetical protein
MHSSAATSCECRSRVRAADFVLRAWVGEWRKARPAGRPRAPRRRLSTMGAVLRGAAGGASRVRPGAAGEGRGEAGAGGDAGHAVVSEGAPRAGHGTPVDPSRRFDAVRRVLLADFADSWLDTAGAPPGLAAASAATGFERCSPRMSPAPTECIDCVASTCGQPARSNATTTCSPRRTPMSRRKLVLRRTTSPCVRLSPGQLSARQSGKIASPSDSPRAYGPGTRGAWRSCWETLR